MYGVVYDTPTPYIYTSKKGVAKPAHYHHHRLAASKSILIPREGQVLLYSRTHIFSTYHDFEPFLRSVLPIAEILCYDLADL